jgi:hypothetical protein
MWMELKGFFSYFSFHNWFFFNTIITNCIIICEIWNKYDYIFMWWHYLSQIKVVINCSKCDFWEVKVEPAFLRYNYIHVNYITHNWIGHTWLHSQSRHTIFTIHLGLCQCGQTPPKTPIFNFMFVIRFQWLNNGFVTQWKVNTPNSYLMTHQKSYLLKLFL